MKPRKLILSRKGFDSKYGGCPSPIFPDDTMYSLPIPGYGYEEPIHYSDLWHGNINIGQVVEGLTGGRHEARDLAGLDPDVRQDAVPRYDGWRGLIGQSGAPQTHLANQWVDKGDVFLFFGLFRRVHETHAGWRFVRSAPELHMLWGWLQIEQVCKVDDIRHDEKFDWATYHCHFSSSGDPRNTLYVATDQLDLTDTVTMPGAGVFPKFDERLVLTEPGGLVSRWRLPRWFYPDGDKTSLTYHPRELWRQDGNFAYVQRRGPGQEFVLDSLQYPESMGWLSGLVRDFGYKAGQDDSVVSDMEPGPSKQTDGKRNLGPRWVWQAETIGEGEEAITTGAMYFFSGDCTIEVVTKENPHKVTGRRPMYSLPRWERYDLYVDGMTVQEYINAGGEVYDVEGDVIAQHIVLNGEFADYLRVNAAERDVVARLFAEVATDADIPEIVHIYGDNGRELTEDDLTNLNASGPVERDEEDES